MSFFNNLSSLFNSKKPGHALSAAPKAHQKPVAPVAKQTAAQPTQQNQPPAVPQHAPQQPQKSPQPQQPVRAQKPQVIDESYLREAQARAREIIVEAKDEALALRSKAEQESRERRRQLEEQERSVDVKLDRIETRLTQMDEREKQLETAREKLRQVEEQTEKVRVEEIAKLESIANMTRDEAKSVLMDSLEKKLTKDMATLIRQKEQEAKAEADEKAKEILADAMKHGANDYVVEYTVSIVQLGSEEDKGRIIGKAGRNIHEFERRTGVDVDLDVSPTEVRLSCFDPVRREIARISLERLIKDGRIQPSRIEEVVAKVTGELDKIMFEEGKKLCHTVGVFNMPNELMQLLGRFKYRFSYGQNLIAHTLEETKIGIKIAHELKLDVNTVKLGCLLHDIGKVVNDEEGSHVELGVKVAKKYGMPQQVIDCIEQHHEDKPFSGPEQMAVYAADAISGARPGARYENYEEYVKRLEKLEAIAKEYPEVEMAYAIQAGREVRVLLVPEKSKDDDVQVLAIKIRDRIKNEMTYPGTVTVTVIRETRSQEVAK